MTLYRRSTLIRLGVVLAVLLLVISACGGDEDKDAEKAPTVPATVTPPPTRTQIGFQPSPTAFPTWTPYQSVLLPTATQLVLLPTATPFATWTSAAPTATAYPYDVRITYPVDGSEIAGYVTVVGSASHARFVQYALEWGPDPNPNNLWYPFLAPPQRTNIVVSGSLGAWNTTLVSDGIYQIRVHVWLDDGTDIWDVVTGIRVSNTRPTAVPTATNTPRPNQLPVINPIPSQQITTGQTATVRVTTSDPDGDAVNLFVASSDPAVALVQFSDARNEIAVTGMAAGTATITVTANDNHGGSVNAAFVVTVQGQNAAPKVDPIPNQSLEVGRMLDLEVKATDPDGDPLTIDVSSDNQAVVSVNKIRQDAMRIQGVAQGAATISVTVNDGKGGVVNIAFQVSVGVANQPPTLDAIPAQTMDVGDTLDVPYRAFDPDGDTLAATAVSDNLGVASANVSRQGTVSLVAIGSGSATITLTVNDGLHPDVSVKFPVSVGMGNQPPKVDLIPGQSLMAGGTLDVPYNATDPDGDLLTALAMSSDVNVVTANVSAPGMIALIGNNAGTATVTLTVNDGVHPDVSVPFQVTVAVGNQPPVVDAIGPQSLAAGGTLDVPYNATDPDGDLLTALAVSSDETVVTASVNVPAMIALIGNNAGTATVTLTVNDGVHPDVSVPFQVTVAVGNQPPVVDAIGPQSLAAGGTLDVPYNATDPDGDLLTALAVSSDETVVTANVSAPGMIALIGNNAGTATVTLTVNDGVHPDVSVPFQVTVTAANQPPVIQTVGEQVVDEGASLTVPMQVTDPDGDPVMLAAVSDHPEIATASASGLDVIIGGVVPGTATLTVDADDGQGGMASTSFMVTVKGLNSPPVIGPIVEQALTVGEQITLPLDITDLDGDAVIVTAIPQDGGVVAATVVDNNSVVLDGLAEGTTAVDLTADDARGGITTATFTVAVSSAAPAFDLMAYPVLPEITPQMANMLELTYQGGLSLGNQAGAFSKVGDELMDGPDFMAPFASDTYNLGSYGSLQDTIDFYRGTPVRDDTTINSFNVDSVAAEPGFGLDMLSSTAPGVPPCDTVGGTNLSCEYLVTHPSIALISFSAANVTYMDPAEFRNELQTLVFDSMSTYGVIPVLATVPADASATTEQLTEYNRTIVEVANESGIPLWNLWRAMAERGITDPAGTSPDGPAIFTDPALSFGVNVRNLTALQVLEAVRQAANIP